MTRLILTSLLGIVLGLPAAAQNCTIDIGYCVPFVGCIEDGSGYFVGYSFGKDKGPIRAQSQDGSVCTGRWWRTAIGTGKARFTCDDGRSGTARYTYFDRATGTAAGRGRTNDNARITFLAGHRYAEFFETETGNTPEMINCISDSLDSR